MCGIICTLTSDNTIEKNESLVFNIRNRGPDYFNEVTLPITSSQNAYFAASVLHTQGVELAVQPIILNNGDVLLWNGDVFGGQVLAEVPHDNISDSHILAKWLEINDGNIEELIGKIEGPYSLIYLNQKQKYLWFCRDPLGRHSLLWKMTEERIFLSSVGHKSIPDLEEVPAVGLFCAHIDSPRTKIQLYPWTHWNDHIPLEELPSSVLVSDSKINKFCNLRMCSDEPINEEVFFENSDFTSNTDLMEKLIRDPKVEYAVNELLDLLMESCRKRIFYRKNVCVNCSDSSFCEPEHVKLGILFSGGLDSTIIACIADKFVPKTEAIDLLNVAFERNHNFEVPDRKTGKMSLVELQTVCPDRIWNFVEINVTQDELVDVRKNRITHLIYPLNTVLDESLGCALWFACRGKGFTNNVPYVSSAKVVLLGSGADEQFGGYVRHRNLLRRNNWSELQKQLLKETILISKRNLGRDDRIACDSGRQPRFPFLDESVVEYVAGLPPWKKCDPVSFPPGVGDKLILRLVATKLGLVRCSTFPKRAFQFGCRIANSKEKGDDSSARL